MRIKQDLSEKPPGCWNSARKCIEVSEKCSQREEQSKIKCLCSWKGHCKTDVSLSKTTENVHKMWFTGSSNQGNGGFLNWERIAQPHCNAHVWGSCTFDSPWYTFFLNFSLSKICILNFKSLCWLYYEMQICYSKFNCYFIWGILIGHIYCTICARHNSESHYDVKIIVACIKFNTVLFTAVAYAGTRNLGLGWLS